MKVADCNKFIEKPSKIKSKVKWIQTFHKSCADIVQNFQKGSNPEDRESDVSPETKHQDPTKLANRAWQKLREFSKRERIQVIQEKRPLMKILRNPVG